MTCNVSKIVAIIFLMLIQMSVSSQTVGLLSIEELNTRLQNGKDTTYIINFWATWCAPCVKELPAFEKLSSSLSAEKQKVLLVSVNFKSQLKTDVIPFVKKKKYKLETLLLNEANPQEYIDRIDKTWSGSIPATLIVKNDKRTFLEKELTYIELLTAYKTIQ